MPLLRVLAYVWASPNTILGILFGLLSFQRPRTQDGILVFDADRRGFIWLIALFRRAAITYGHVVLSNSPVQGSLLVHELHHVRQYERLGPLYIPLYVLIWVFTGYRGHPFEEAARLAEMEAR
ncbi:MAG: hypothetical protein ACRDH9_06980 [Actinomycetota bacterium]